MKCNFPIYHVRNRIFFIMSGMSMRFKIEMIDIGNVVVVRLTLGVGKLKRPMLAGELKAEVRHVASGRLIPVTVSQKDASHYYIDFVPDQVGDYLINIYWTDTPIPNSPIR